ncbi:hypothetical protein BBO99_00009227 [Phytophthora kernoviae]|uniref:Uncharacterized protein n=2 Tax=Phytophthora kernoviae TaxID=325452 RepID=A0A3R7GQP8_9STRA|nr:hypothetical protein G195_010868 [Phytophthora kernoviae 00238/432]KAG2506619.1 hypothetical protein JM16_009121 [Phytophthora kernoviae]KAG2508690.1 hypothetical protein JM18_009135 [Phytophthora kernoviae]RLN21602.1 hypothetical protein BBI17_009252 [Phytophthora kernoviae]RLN73806.1 hypothetical protein BBO99_00009227 [Phytophthora kernoviae]
MDFRQLLREERRRAREAANPEPVSDPIASKEDAEDSEFNSHLQRSPLKVWGKRSEIDIEQFRKGPIPGVYYIPNWITQQEEEAVLERVYAVPDDNDIWCMVWEIVFYRMKTGLATFRLWPLSAPVLNVVSRMNRIAR